MKHVLTITILTIQLGIVEGMVYLNQLEVAFNPVTMYMGGVQAIIVYYAIEWVIGKSKED